MASISEYEERFVRELGDQIGYGRMMQLAEQLWDAKMPGVGCAHSVGPCTAFLVPCPHPEKDANGHCEWCCGSGRVTKRVLAAMSTPPVAADGDGAVVERVARALAALDHDGCFDDGGSEKKRAQWRREAERFEATLATLSHSTEGEKDNG